MRDLYQCSQGLEPSPTRFNHILISISPGQESRMKRITHSICANSVRIPVAWPAHPLECGGKSSATPLWIVWSPTFRRLCPREALPKKLFPYLDKPVDAGSADALVRTSVRSTLRSRGNRLRLFALHAQLRARAPAFPVFARPLSRELSF